MSEIEDLGIPLRLRKFLSLYTTLSNRGIKSAWEENRIQIIKRQLFSMKESVDMVSFLQKMFSPMCSLESFNHESWKSGEVELNKGNLDNLQDIFFGLSQIVFPLEDEIFLDGVRISPVYFPKRISLVFNKPVGVECTVLSSDEIHKKSCINVSRDIVFETFIKNSSNNISESKNEQYLCDTINANSPSSMTFKTRLEEITGIHNKNMDEKRRKKKEKKDNSFRKCTLYEFMQEVPQGVVPVGRLDKDTTGLLLFTNDHDLNHSIRKKGNLVLKEYHLLLQEKGLTLEDHRLQALLNGVHLPEGFAKVESIAILQSSTMPMSFRKLGSMHSSLEIAETNRISNEKIKEGIQETTTLIALEIHEGRKHIVRKLCKFVRLQLLHLHRHRIGNIALSPRLPAMNVSEPKECKEGEWRVLEDEEVADLWALCEPGSQRTVNVHRLEALVRIVLRCRSVGTPFSRLENWLEHHRQALLSFLLKESSFSSVHCNNRE